MGTPEQDKRLHESIAALRGDHSLVQALQAAQEIYGYLPEDVIQVIATEMNVSSESVYSVATFYSQFAFNPKGKYAISVCLGTACYVKGSGEIYAKLKEKLGVEDGGCTPDGKFSLDACRCMPIGTNVEGKMVAALRRLGFDDVFDTDFSADLTILEEATELVERIKTGGKLPLITSCSPGWINYCEHYYPEFIDNLSSCKSPQEMFGAVAKSWYAQKLGIDPKNMFVVSIMMP